MISLKVTDNREDIREWTGLPGDNHDEALWNAGFDLDDWDMCIESEERLTFDGEASWLLNRMDLYCCGYNEVEYNGKWYYTIHHA